MTGDDGRQVGGNAAGFTGDRGLHAWIGGNVHHEPAHGAGEVMMVLAAQCLAQLEAIVIADARHPLQDPDALEDDQIAIQRALRDLGVGLTQQVRH